MEVEVLQSLYRTATKLTITTMKCMCIHALCYRHFRVKLHTQLKPIFWENRGDENMCEGALGNYTNISWPKIMG